MKQNPIVDIIMPAYNAERYIEEAINSVKRQDFMDWRLVVVDDGSTDRTNEISTRFAREDKRIEVLKQENMGCYSAKLTGIKHVGNAARYITFLDADDYFELAALKILVETAEKNQLDVVQCEFAKPNNQKLDSVKILRNRQEVFSSYIKPCLIKGQSIACTCGKLYKSHLFAIKLKELPITTFEDLAYNLQVFANVNRMGFIAQGLYKYRINEGSSVRNFPPSKIRDLEAIIELRSEVLTHVYGFKASDRVWIWRNVMNYIKLAIRINASFLKKVGTIIKIIKVWGFTLCHKSAIIFKNV